MTKPIVPNDHYKYFSNKQCPYYPCHKVDNEDEFNCLFCFCPLYLLGTECGGNYTFTSQGVKDCTNCTLPHTKDGYEHIMNKYDKILIKSMESLDSEETFALKDPTK